MSTVQYNLSIDEKLIADFKKYCEDRHLKYSTLFSLLVKKQLSGEIDVLSENR